MVGLDELRAGEVGVVRTVGGEGTFRRRMLELGMVPGTRVQRLGNVGLNDPIRVRVRHAVVALRRADAAIVCVERP